MLREEAKLRRRDFLKGLLGCPLCAQAAHAEAVPHWEYLGDRGAEKWAELDAAFKVCGAGREQSPIDLKDVIPARIDRLAFDWEPQVLEIANTGHTIQAECRARKRASERRRAIRIQAVSLPYAERTRIERRALRDGGSLPALASRRAVRRRRRVSQRRGDKCGFRRHHEGRAGARGQSEAGPAPRSEGPAAGGGALYRYKGSFTTPPCSEIVEWNVFGAPVTVSEADIGAFRSIFPEQCAPSATGKPAIYSSGRLTRLEKSAEGPFRRPAPRIRPRNSFPPRPQML